MHSEELAEKRVWNATPETPNGRDDVVEMVRELVLLSVSCCMCRHLAWMPSSSFCEFGPISVVHPSCIVIEELLKCGREEEEEEEKKRR